MKKLMILVVTVVLFAPSTVLAGIRHLSSSDWTPQEKWVWGQVSQGGIADFNKAKGYGGELDPREPEGWQENRILRPKFLETILLHERYRNALTRLGVRIVGAWFKEPLDLSNASLPRQLWLTHCRFDSNVSLQYLKTPYLISLDGSKFKGKLIMGTLEGASHLVMSNTELDNEVVLYGAKIGGYLDMCGSKFKGKLIMDRLEVTGDLFMRNNAQFDNEVLLPGAKIGGGLDMIGSKFKDKLIMGGLEVASSLFMRDNAEFGNEVVLTGAKIGGSLDMIGSKFKDKLIMDSLEVASSLFMRDNAEFGNEVLLTGAKIGGSLDMSGSKFKGKLIMDSLEVARNLFMRDNAEFDSEVVLSGTRIGGQLGMSGSKFKGRLIMDCLQVGGHLLMKRAIFIKPIDLTFAVIGGSLNVSGSSLISLDLSSTQLNQDFCLSSENLRSAKWEKGAKLSLGNTYVGALQDLPDAWPDEVTLAGFTYSRLGGPAGGDEYSMATREVLWMEQWLKKQENYLPQPYEQLASILRKTGYKDKARDILYAGRERERSTVTGLNWLGVTLLKYIIGYGYNNFRVLYWVLILCGLGILTLRLSGQEAAHRMKYWGLSYSLDMLLPYPIQKPR
jgi:hypothetical protein